MKASLQVPGRCNREGMWKLWWVVGFMLKSWQFLFELSERQW